MYNVNTPSIFTTVDSHRWTFNILIVSTLHPKLHVCMPSHGTSTYKEPYSLNTTHLIISTNLWGTKAVDLVTPRHQIYSTLSLFFSPCEDIDLTSGQMIGYPWNDVSPISLSIHQHPTTHSLPPNNTHFLLWVLLNILLTIL
jgi:hypothetical protein